MSTFTSREAELVFYLTQLDGKARTRLLGVTDQLYKDASMAQRWRDGIKAELTDTNNPSVILAISKLDSLYEIMTST